MNRGIILLYNARFLADAYYVDDWHFCQVWKLFLSRSVVVILKFVVSKKNIFVWKGDTKKSYEMIKDHGATRVEF